MDSFFVIYKDYILKSVPKNQVYIMQCYLDFIILGIKAATNPKISTQTKLKKFDLLYLSDIFEYMSQEKTNQLTPYIYNSLNECGQVLFFNMMNTRRLYGDFLEELVDQKFNRTFYYKAFYSYIKKNSND